jgi:hypothetical protein
MLVPLIEVTAPDGTKSFWVAYLRTHKDAVAAVKERIPSDHHAELSLQRVPRGLKFDRGRPGDVFRVELWPRCTSCASSLRLTQTLLDPRKGKTIRLYQCKCGVRIWDDGFDILSQG